MSPPTDLGDRRVLASGVTVSVEDAPLTGASDRDLLLEFAASGIAPTAGERSDLQRPYFRRRATVSAELGGCRALRASIFPGSYFIRLGRQDETLGHAAFDDRYIVKTRDAALLRFWLGTDECEAILATYSPSATLPFTLTIDAGKLELQGYSNVETRPTPPERLDQAIEAAGFLAARPTRLADQWRTRLAPLGALTAGTHFGLDDDFAIRIEFGLATIELTFPYQLPMVGPRGLRTQLRVLRREPSPLVGALWRRSLPFVTRPPRTKLITPTLQLGVFDGDDQPTPWLAAALTPVERALDRAAPDALHVGAEAIALRWERIVDDVDTLRAAIAVLAHLGDAAHSVGGPYR